MHSLHEGHAVSGKFSPSLLPPRVNGCGPCDLGKLDKGVKVSASIISNGCEHIGEHTHSFILLSVFLQL